MLVPVQVLQSKWVMEVGSNEIECSLQDDPSNPRMTSAPMTTSLIILYYSHNLSLHLTCTQFDRLHLTI